MDTEEIEIIPGRCVVCDGPVETEGGLLFCEFCPAVDEPTTVPATTTDGWVQLLARD